MGISGNTTTDTGNRNWTGDVGFSLTLDFETTKKLILMESRLENKLEEINNKIATQDSMNLLNNKIDEQYFHIQILELKNEINSLKEELRRNHS